jgi:hypothetical protein
MNGVILSPQDALLRSTDEQVGVLLDFYDDPQQVDQRLLDPAFVERRRQSLTTLREALRAQLARRELLPKQQDDDVSAWHFLVDRLHGLLRDEPLAVPLEEERRLFDLCDELLKLDGSSADLRKGRSATRQAMQSLKRPQN